MSRMQTAGLMAGLLFLSLCTLAGERAREERGRDLPCYLEYKSRETGQQTENAGNEIEGMIEQWNRSDKRWN